MMIVAMSFCCSHVARKIKNNKKINKSKNQLLWFKDKRKEGFGSRVGCGCPHTFGHCTYCHTTSNTLPPLNNNSVFPKGDSAVVCFQAYDSLCVSVCVLDELCCQQKEK